MKEQKAMNSNSKEQKAMNSNSAAAKKIIRDEIRTYFNPHDYGVRSTVDAMKKDADAYNADCRGRQCDYKKGAALVDAGSLACYYEDQRVMLGKIYGKEKVKDWEGEKVHNTYKHLIGREYSAMLSEKEKRKAIKRAMKARAKKQKEREKKSKR